MKHQIKNMIDNLDLLELAHAGQVFDGNISKIKKLFEKAEKGEKLTIAFIGGSITLGCHAEAENQYTHQVFDWFVRSFPNSEFTFLNAPVGATDSQFGNARLKQQVLNFNPDFLLVEFAVNDWGDDLHKETYEGLIRTILSWKKVPAVLGLMNVIVNDRGDNAEKQHLEILRYYDIPAVSMKQNIYAAIEKGLLERTDYSLDRVHPNDFGHRMVGLTITEFLERVMKTTEYSDTADCIPEPLTANHYQNSLWLRNMDIEPELTGFVKDYDKAPYDDYYFINGWRAYEPDSMIKFKASIKALAVQYERYSNAIAPKAVITVDGKNPIILDAEFDEDWGDCLYLKNIFCEDEVREHIIEVKITQVPKNSKPFYMVSFIGYN